MKRKILLFSLAAALGTTPTFAQTLMALTSNNELITIANANTPGTVSTPVAITGVTIGQTIVGIDYRPNTGELYALGYNDILPLLNSQVYVINPTTGAATAIGSAITLSLGNDGIGFDFNPTVDRIRVVGENGANYRLHPTTGALVSIDGNLAYAVSDVNAGATPAVAACGYTNSYIGSEATTLFNYDKGLNILVSQIPPNNGTLNTIGASGITVGSTSNIGMDIYFDPTTKTNWAYLNANVGGINNLYAVNASTGAATLVGTIGNGSTDIREIAVQIDRTVPATYSGQLLYGLTRVNRNLVSFSSGDPQLIRSLLPITGITAGQTIVGMDVRPMDLGLYALGYNDTTRTYQLYTINTTTGAATAVGTSGTIHLGFGQKIGFDFNPTVDRIRVVSTNDSNYRLNPITGAIAATDTSLMFASADVNTGKNPYVSSVAYINSYKGTTTTGLFGLDDSLGAFVSITPPNQGVLNTLANNIMMFNLADLTNDMDFFYDSTSATNIGYMAANIGTSMNDMLYSVTNTGTAAMLDTIGLGVQLYDIAVQLTYTNSNTNNVNELSRANNLQVYPNPVHDVLNVTIHNNSVNERLVITDITGKIVTALAIPRNASVLQVNVSSLVNGVYFMKLANEKSNAIKFLKN